MARQSKGAMRFSIAMPGADFRMWKVYAVVGLIWLALLPPLFTNGACTAEFDAEMSNLKTDAARFRTAALAEAYWSSRDLPATILTAEKCRLAKPRFLSRCSNGPLVYVRVPVKTQVCRLYRDNEILVQLQYDGRGNLARIATDMKPFKSLPLPFVGITLHWAR